MRNRRLAWCGVVPLVLCIADLSTGQTVNLSGKLKANPSKSDYAAVMPVLPDITLVVAQDEKTLTVKTFMNGEGGEQTVEMRFTTDRKECVNTGRGISDLKGICWIENGTVHIQTEAEGARGEGAPDGGPPTLHYFKYKLERELTISRDQKSLTSIETLDTPDGKLRMKLVFDRVEQR